MRILALTSILLLGVRLHGFAPTRRFKCFRTSSRLELVRGDLATLTVPALQQLCRERGLKLGGRKAELVERLQARDLVPDMTPDTTLPTAYKVPVDVRRVFDAALPTLGDAAWAAVGGACGDDVTFHRVLPGLTSVLVTRGLPAGTRVLCLGPADWGKSLGLLSGATVDEAASAGSGYALIVGRASTVGELSALAKRTDGRLELAGDAVGQQLPESGLLCLWQGRADELRRAQIAIGTAVAATFPVKGFALGAESTWLYFSSIELFNRDPNIVQETDFEVSKQILTHLKDC